MNSIIVTNSFGRAQHLVERSLRASLNQSPRPMQVIFIDQNPTPLDLSSDIANHQLLKTLKVNKNSVSAARNSIKIPENCDWIIFCDDDGYLCENYLQKLNEYNHKKPHLKIIAGSIIRDDNGEYYSIRHKKGGSLESFFNTKLLMGSNLVVHAEVFKQLQGFDERFGVGSKWGSSEETDFAWKAYFKNIPMEYNSELQVIHVRPYAESFSKSFKKAFRYGKGKGALVAKWLFFEGQFRVLAEFVEMILLPFVQFLRAILTLNFILIPLNFSALLGRLWGFILFPVQNKYPEERSEV